VTVDSRHLQCRYVVRITHWCLRLFVPEVMLMCLLCKQHRCPSQSCVISALQTELNAENTKDVLPFHIHIFQFIQSDFMEAIFIQTLVCCISKYSCIKTRKFYLPFTRDLLKMNRKKELPCPLPICFLH